MLICLMTGLNVVLGTIFAYKVILLTVKQIVNQIVVIMEDRLYCTQALQEVVERILALCNSSKLMKNFFTAQREILTIVGPSFSDPEFIKNSTCSAVKCMRQQRDEET